MEDGRWKNTQLPASNFQLYYLVNTSSIIPYSFASAAIIQ
jgi:hypothetical protein